MTLRRMNEEGQGLTEYLILLILVSVVSIGAVQILGHTVNRKIRQASAAINREVTFGNPNASDEDGAGGPTNGGGSGGGGGNNDFGGVIDKVKGIIGW